MTIKSVEFKKGVRGTDDIFEDGTPQISFVGRSNVGKSSVMNSLFGHKGMVKSSSTPGKTREINFFLVNKEKYFVDLPGYGYAKMSKKDADKLRKLIIWYLSEIPVNPAVVALLVDAKVGATSLDLEMFELLKSENQNVVIVANKIDKLPKTKRAPFLKKIEVAFPDTEIIPYSAKTHEGREVLLDKLL